MNTGVCVPEGRGVYESVCVSSSSVGSYFGAHVETGPVGTGAASVGGPISPWRPARRTPRLPSPAYVHDHPGEAYAGPRDEEGEREYSRSLLGCLALRDNTYPGCVPSGSAGVRT